MTNLAPKKLTTAAFAKLVEAVNGNGLVTDALPKTRQMLIDAKCAELTAPDHRGITSTKVTLIGRMRAKRGIN